MVPTCSIGLKKFICNKDILAKHRNLILNLFLHSTAIQPSVYIRKIKSVNEKVTSVISLSDVK